jgi:hypothetical protein
VLPISRQYFRLRRPIDRRIYEIARKHCGKQPSRRVSLGLLQKKCGSKQEGKHFAAHLRNLVNSNHLPDYGVTMEAGQVVFHRREGKLQDFVKPPAPVPVVTAMEPEEERPKGIFISSGAIERLYELAPGWDRYMLERRYCEWAADKEAARNEDSRFFGWVRNYTKGKPP